MTHQKEIFFCKYSEYVKIGPPSWLGVYMCMHVPGPVTCYMATGGANILWCAAPKNYIIIKGFLFMNWPNMILELKDKW